MFGGFCGAGNGTQSGLVHDIQGQGVWGKKGSISIIPPSMSKEPQAEYMNLSLINRCEQCFLSASFILKWITG